ncbi:MAG: ATP-dependent helicase [Patescibacteria group bacterium]|nr:ATP-dependent helicase [Patescibacteria group bacterium]
MAEKILNEEQIKAIEHGDGPLMIIAGAGTGKTTVITERIRYLILSGKAKPQEILALTFTEKASHEMEERVDQALPYGIVQLWISTFHSFCDRILRNDGIHIGINPSYRLMTEAESLMFFRKHLFSFDLEYFRPLGNPNKFIRAMIQHFSRLQDEDVNPDQYHDWVDSNAAKTHHSEEYLKYRELARVYQQYQALKLREGMFDFSDVIFYTLALFRKRPHVLEQYQHQFRYILIDEFQDTNYAQNQLAILLAGEKKNITVVGDDDQAIYRFRGAAISNMIQFRQTFPETTVIVLTKNYRSTKEILDRSYDLIQYNNPDRLEIAEKIDKKLESMRRVKGDAVELIIADRVDNEAEAVAKRILDLTSGDDIAWRDIAVLVRANAHAEPFVRAFQRCGIPFQFLGPGQLFRQPEIKDLIAYLKVLYSFDDTVAMYRVLSMDIFGLSGRDIASLVNTAKHRGMSLFEVCESLSGDDELTKKIHTIVSMIHRHLDIIRKESAGQILYYFLQDTGMLKKLTEYHTHKDERIVQNISAFFDKLKTYELEHPGEADVYSVVDWIQLSMELGESPLAASSDWSSNNAVNILTVHSSKGLEFPIVFLVNLVTSRFPSNERKEQIPVPQEIMREILPEGDVHLQEERRLFYVGMTRARDRLILTAANYYGEGKRKRKMSPFVIEAIGEESVAKAETNIVGNTRQLSFLEDWKQQEETVETERQNINPLQYVSYSQLESFTTCPLQYKYRYILKIPVPPSAALSFGDTLHQTMCAFYSEVKQGKHQSFDDMLAIYREKWISRGYGNVLYENKMKQHGEELLREFYEHAYDPNIIPRDLEQPFRITITPTVKLGGKIDRVDIHNNGQLEIIDYKTGQSTKIKNVDTDLQLSVYALAATDQGIYGYRPEDVIVSFYFFEGHQKVSSQRTKEQLEQAKEHIAKKIKEMETSSYVPTPGKHCDFCEFRLICEAWE